MARRRSNIRLAWLAGVLASCTGDDGPSRPVATERHERYGILRDLVLIPRPDSRGGPYFIDRFESSRRDVLAFFRATGVAPPAAWLGRWRNDDGDPDHLQPAVRIDLDLARAFAHWRFCRLPTFDEWDYAATANGTYRFPWGDHGRAEWANTPELGLGRSVPVGTFESGRSPGGPYELVGNVAEWTDSLRPETAAALALAAGPSPAAAAIWGLPATPRSLLELLAVARSPVPRVVTGGAFLGLSGSSQRRRSQAVVPILEACPQDWSDTIGVRLAADPLSLLAALLGERHLPRTDVLRELESFLARPGHRAALAPALPVALRRAGEGALAGLLRGALQR